jgi:hypothetical protein
MGALSWHIQDGRGGATDLGGLNVALALRYDDDEPGSPWDFVLFVDERGDERQRELLEAIFTGALGGDAVGHFPWAWKESRLISVQPALIELDHTPRRQWFRVGKSVSLRISGPVPDDSTVTCVVPGHHQPGEELIAEHLEVDEGPLRFAFSGNCGYAAAFDYSSG